MGVSASGKEAANGPSATMRTKTSSKARICAGRVGVWVRGRACCAHRIARSCAACSNPSSSRRLACAS
eukprot:53177-Prymnesium_polylepis.1